jgi:predicted RNA-binding Zn ribbon-like protein
MEELELIREFVNTVDLEEEREDLDSAAALQRWLAAHGLVSESAHAVGADLRAALTLREALRDLALANNDVDVDADEAASTLEWAARRARLVVRFGEDGSVRFEPGAAGVAGALGKLVAAVATAMAEGSWSRFKACRSDTCRWAFVDESRNSSRTWCSMEVCGNREKARAFRRRERH